jgi:hypothetical protein
VYVTKPELNIPNNCSEGIKHPFPLKKSGGQISNTSATSFSRFDQQCGTNKDNKEDEKRQLNKIGDTISSGTKE